MTTVCIHRSIPGKTECYEACWSQGRFCKKCYRNDCYRQGWDKYFVDDDNRQLVAKTISELKSNA